MCSLPDSVSVQCLFIPYVCSDVCWYVFQSISSLFIQFVLYIYGCTQWHLLFITFALKPKPLINGLLYYALKHSAISFHYIWLLHSTRHCGIFFSYPICISCYKEFLYFDLAWNITFSGIWSLCILCHFCAYCTYVYLCTVNEHSQYN